MCIARNNSLRLNCELGSTFSALWNVEALSGAIHSEAEGHDAITIICGVAHQVCHIEGGSTFLANRAGDSDIL
jgi:hypothetical protein